MKKVIPMLAVLALAVLLLSSMVGQESDAPAELPLFYPQETVISVLGLTPGQQELAKGLYAPLMAGEERISLPPGTRYEDAARAMRSMTLDYPELFHVGNRFSISYYQRNPEQAVAVIPEYCMDAEAAMEMRMQLYTAAYRMIEEDRTAVGLHDALLRRVVYGGEGGLVGTAAGALIEGRATCQGYAEALCLLYRLAGIPCGVVIGTAAEKSGGPWSGHAWNIMDLGGFSLIDPTWNDQEKNGYTSHWYFGLSSEQMAADHLPDEEMAVPVCDDHANWHRLFGRYADSREDIFFALQQLVEQGTPLDIRVTDAALFADVTDEMGGLMDAYNEWCPEGSAFYGRYTTFVNREQQCVRIVWTQE